MYIFICSTEIPFDEVSLAITRLTYYDIHAPPLYFQKSSRKLWIVCYPRIFSFFPDSDFMTKHIGPSENTLE